MDAPSTQQPLSPPVISQSLSVSLYLVHLYREVVGAEEGSQFRCMAFNRAFTTYSHSLIQIWRSIHTPLQNELNSLKELFVRVVEVGSVNGPWHKRFPQMEINPSVVSYERTLSLLPTSAFLAVQGPSVFFYTRSNASNIPICLLPISSIYLDPDIYRRKCLLVLLACLEVSIITWMRYPSNRIHLRRPISHTSTATQSVVVA